MPEAPGVPDSGDGEFRAANARLRELLAERDERIAGQDAEIAALREHPAELQSQVADLAARVKPNSRNSSGPPSSDGLAKPAPKSLRGKSARKPGRPKGQPGATLQLSGHPDNTVRHRPARCGCCGRRLKGAGVTAVERRQVIDIPQVRAKTTEHQVLTVLCGCGHETKAEAPAGVTAPVQYGPRLMGTGIYLWHGQFLSRDRSCQALSELFGCAPSPGALAAAAKKTAGLLAPALAAIRQYLISAEVVHFGETGLRAAGTPAWVHSASWGKFVLVTVHAKRGKEGMPAAGILPFLTGIAVHDAWKPYGTFENVAGHALRCARTAGARRGHRDRHGPGPGAGAAGHRRAARPRPGCRGGPRRRRDRRQPGDTGRARGLVPQGRRSRDRPQRWHGTLQGERHALAARMQAREDGCLRFARDLRVPFNNEAERAIRMSKLRIKISGCMRSITGAGEFCAIRSCLATAVRHGVSALEALTSAFQANPWIPETG